MLDQTKIEKSVVENVIVNYRNQHSINLKHVVTFKKEFVLGQKSHVIIFFVQGGNVSWPFVSEEERNLAWDNIMKVAGALNV